MPDSLTNLSKHDHVLEMPCLPSRPSEPSLSVGSQELISLNDALLSLCGMIPPPCAHDSQLQGTALEERCICQDLVVVDPVMRYSIHHEYLLQRGLESCSASEDH